MGLFEHFPYTNFHELNLNWLLRKTKENEVNIEKTNNRIDNISAVEGKERKYFFVHDSYGFGYTPSAPQEVGWYYWILKYLGLQDGINAFHVKYGAIVGGYGFASGSGHAPWFDVIPLSLDNVPVNEITDVVIFGGTNDYNDSDSIWLGMQKTDAIIRKTFPNVDRIRCGVFAITRINGFGVATRRVYEEYSKCVELGWEFCSNSVWALHKRSYLASDNLHATQEGYKEGAKYLAQCVRSGNCTVDFVQEIKYKPANGIRVTTGTGVYFSFHNGVITINFNGAVSGVMENLTTIETTLDSGVYNLCPLPDFIFAQPYELHDQIGVGYGECSLFNYNSIIIRDNQLQLNYRRKQAGTTTAFIVYNNLSAAVSGWLA